MLPVLRVGRSNPSAMAIAIGAIRVPAAHHVKTAAGPRGDLDMVRDYDLEVRLVSHGSPSRTIVEMARRFN